MGVVPRSGGRVHELERELASLRALYRLTSVVSESADLDVILDAALRCLHAALGADRSSVLLVDAHGSMRFRAWRGLSESYRRAVDGHSPWDPGDRAPTPIVVSEVDEAPAMEPYLEAFRAEGIRSLAFVPLIARDRLIGKFMIYFAEPHHYTGADVELAQNIAQHVAIAVDRSRTDAELRRSAVILEAVSDGVTVQDASGMLLYANDAAARLTGLADGRQMVTLPVEEILSRFTMFHPDGRPLDPAELPGQRVIAEGREAQALVRFRVNATGEERWSQVSASPVYGPEGALAFAVNLFRDVTREQQMSLRNAELYEREQRARREAEAAVDGRDLLLAVVSHDLRTPLTAIGVAASMLAKLETAAEHADTIRRASTAMDRLISDLLDYERIRAGTLAIRPCKHSLAGILRDAEELMAPVAMDRGVGLRTRVDGEEGLVLACDRARTLQVLTNLLSNAIKFSASGTEVELVAREVDAAVELSVVDRGPGIEPEKLDRIFERYYQADPDGRGIGLGLSISRGLVEAQGGRIRAQSQIGRGTTVSFTVPLTRGS